LTYLEDTSTRKVIFFTGKGGVGKSTLAAATALLARRQGKRVAVVGWDPLGTVDSPPPLAELGLDWIGLETLSAFREYALQILRSEKLYDTFLDNKVLRTFVMAAPGLADAVVAGKIWDLFHRGTYDLLVVDLPSSGHAKSFFKSPLGLKKIFKTGFIARDADRVCALFSSPQTRLDLIALPEELPLSECAELKRALEPLHAFSFGYLHVNQCLPLWLRLPDQVLRDTPPAVHPMLEAMAERVEDQETTLRLSASLNLPQVQVPRFTHSDSKATIEETARFLETQ
jgi:anion-transporting  ArsA/GET3 family ATPase